ncbi:hypothetical protein EDB84DRAFT_1491372 [Lactarius hengduanensis]|nr:hypothetical protein EDB84DRAFT_1491372 [Lactarius hengduanensis]
MLQIDTRHDAGFFPPVQRLARFSHAPGDRVWDRMASFPYQEWRSNTFALLSWGGFSRFRKYMHMFDIRGDLLRCGPGEDRRGRVVHVVPSWVCCFVARMARIAARSQSATLDIPVGPRQCVALVPRLNGREFVGDAIKIGRVSWGFLPRGYVLHEYLVLLPFKLDCMSELVRRIWFPFVKHTVLVRA